MTNQVSRLATFMCKFATPKRGSTIAIQDWLGHSFFSTKANFYAHLDYGTKQDSANAITDVLMIGWMKDTRSPDNKNGPMQPYSYQVE